MTQDKRLWAKIDLGYFTNPKVADVLDESSSAVCMHIASILHCAQHLTDGHVSPKAMQRAVGGSNDDAQLLVRNELWHEQGHDCAECPQPDEGRVYVHDYLRHNTSSGKVHKASERGRKAAQARWEKERSKQEQAPSNANSMQTAMPDAMQTAMPDAMQDELPNAMLDREIDKIDKIDKEESQVAGATLQPDEETTQQPSRCALLVCDLLVRYVSC